jgi:hypothetical protein
MTATPKGAVDWEAVERDFRAGLLTHRAIGAKHGVTHGAVQKRAKAEGWTRDLTAKIRAKAADLVARDPVAIPVASDGRVGERDVIEANAEAIAQVIRSHRTSIGKAQGLTQKLMVELEQQTNEPELLEQIADALATTGDDPEADEKARMAGRLALHGALQLGSRSTTLRTLAESLKTLVTLERQAFRVDETPSEEAGSAATVAVLTGVDDALELVRAKLAAVAEPAPPAA